MAERNYVEYYGKKYLHSHEERAEYVKKAGKLIEELRDLLPNFVNNPEHNVVIMWMKPGKLSICFSHEAFYAPSDPPTKPL